MENYLYKRKRKKERQGRGTLAGEEKEREKKKWGSGGSFHRGRKKEREEAARSHGWGGEARLGSQRQAQFRHGGGGRKRGAAPPHWDEIAGEQGGSRPKVGSPYFTLALSHSVLSVFLLFSVISLFFSCCFGFYRLFAIEIHILFRPVFDWVCNFGLLKGYNHGFTNANIDLRISLKSYLKIESER